MEKNRITFAEQPVPEQIQTHSNNTVYHAAGAGVAGRTRTKMQVVAVGVGEEVERVSKYSLRYWL